MTSTATGRGRYSAQREKRQPPMVGMADLRRALGLTLDQVCARAREDDPSITLTRGALSAIESGTRGASDRVLVALALAYGLTPGALRTDYSPRRGEAA